MEETQLNVQIRTEVGTRKIKAIRREDAIPAIVYGQKKGPTPIRVDRRSYEKIKRQHKGQSVLFHLNVMDGEKKLRDYSAIVKEEQHEPVSFDLIHIDFNRISLKQEIEVQVLIELKGEAVGVKRDGGSLDQPLRELDVVCLPTSIPERIDVDVSALEIGDAIHVSDIVLPSGVKTKHDVEGIVATVVPPMKEEVEASEEEAPTEPEVTKEKKEKTEEKAEESS